MSIVFITVPGEAQKNFANSLYQKTGGGLSLVIVQKPRPKNLLRRLLDFLKTSYKNLFSEIRHSFLLRREKRLQEALGYFREFSPARAKSFSSRLKVIEVESANSPYIYTMLKELSPRLITVWGGPILEPHILKTAKRSINLHFGLCPYYRGALANQHAVINNDLDKIGATILYINSKPDAGEVLATILGDSRKPPRELFRDLNDRAAERYLEIAASLYWGRRPGSVRQDDSQAKIFLRRHWTPKVRYELGKKVVEWEERLNANQDELYERGV